MRLVLKLWIGFGVVTGGVLAIDTAVAVEHEQLLFESDVRHENEAIAQALSPLTERLSATLDERDLHDAVRIAEPGFAVDWLRADDHANLSIDMIGRLKEGAVLTGVDGHTVTTFASSGDGVIRIRRSIEGRGPTIHKAVARWVWVVGATLSAAMAAAFVLGATVVGRPIQRLVDKARRVGQGDLTTPLELDSGDEFSILAVELNDMCTNLNQARGRADQEAQARRSSEAQLRHAERLATVGQLASGIAHEIGTPLNVISGRAALIARRVDADPKVVNNAQVIREQAQRITKIVRQLLGFARRNGPDREPYDLSKLARDVVDLCASLATASHVNVELNLLPVVASVDAAQVEQVVTNLVVNAIQAMPGGGTLAVTLKDLEATPPDGDHPDTYACITVEDEGTGIRDEDRPRLFEPFFTTKDVGAGTGLGLSVSYGIVKDHQGWIDVRSREGGGARFDVYLPKKVPAT